MSLFQRLSEGNGRKPLRLAPCPVAMPEQLEVCGEPLTWKLTTEDSELPGSGFCTTTENVPEDEAVPVAVSCVEETTVVEMGELERRTCAPATKLLPVRVREKLPRLVEAGEMPVRTGVGFMSVTELLEDLEVSAELVALMATLLGDGREVGAVYLPEESMVPSMEEPPAVSLTDQVTAVLEVPETVAENDAELPTRTLAVEGETATVMEAGGGGCVLFVEEAEPQAAREKEKRSNVAQRAGVGARIRSPIFGEGGREDNWTEGQKRGSSYGGENESKVASRKLKVESQERSRQILRWRTASEGRPYKGEEKKNPGPTAVRKAGLSWELKRDVFVGDFWAWGASGEGVVGVSGLVVVFNVSGAACSGSRGHAAAFATST
jgi:hypothetical protein